ncbi:hypothetical protein ABKV19_006891 [Rosa sericea]
MSKLSLPSNLKEIKLRGCKECIEVPKLGHLPNLRSLYIEMPNLERLGSDFYGYDPHEATTGCQTKALFPALKSLTIHYAGKLIEWSEPQVLLPTVVFQSLETLNLQGSPQLRSAPSYFPSLKSLSLVKIDSGVPVTSVLSKLTTLTYLHISGVKGLDCLPEGTLRNNKNLARLKIYRCEELTCIAPHGFGCCASLQSLMIVGCNKLRYLPEGLLAPSLEELLIINCPSLESIPFTEGIEYGSLHTLRIKKCSTLTSIPSLQGFSFLGAIEISECSELLSLPSGLNCCTSLGKIKIHSCNKLMFISIDSLPSLQQLDIRTCSSLESIDALHGLPSLHELTIRDCDKLTSLLGSFPYLDRLEIRNCPSLETIPCSDNLTTLSSLKVYSCDGLISKLSELASLTSLRRLEVGEFCKELDSFPVVPQLETLMLSGWPKLKSLHEQIQHFTSLTSLIISSFDEVEALPEWLGSLSSLTVLNIERCHNLKYLPSRQAMQRLTKLSSLNILCDCPLIKRCRKGGPEWPKISHIPYLFLRGV